ncbi:MAG: IS1380 family transposase [Roseimicrobium sp.]
MHQTQAGTECTQAKLEFQALGQRRVEADFSGGHLSSEGGCLLLQQMDQKLRLSERLAECFRDRRVPRFVEHDLQVMLRQRILGLALGYEDLNDHDQLRRDPLMAAACGRADVLGENRHHTSDKGCPLAGKSTLNRLELGAQECTQTKKIHADADKIRDLLLEMAVAAIPRKSGVIVLDFDATDDLIHGRQEGRFYHGYYGGYCYLPLYCFCGDLPLWAQLRTADGDGAQGTLEALQQIVRGIRRRFGPQVVIVVRADSGFCRDELMSWIEAQHHVYYVLGLARNVRLQGMLADALWRAAALLDEEVVLCARAAGAHSAPVPEGTARVFEELCYRTLKSWSRARRVVGKAEITQGKTNPRFIVTNITGTEPWARHEAQFADGGGLYERFYCARGNMENRIKEQQLDLFADRTSTAWQSSNQLRLWFSTFAYLLMSRLRAVALQGTGMAQATVGTIRLRLLKIAAQINVSVRRIHVQLPKACVLKEVFALAQRRLADFSP